MRTTAAVFFPSLLFSPLFSQLTLTDSAAPVSSSAYHHNNNKEEGGTGEVMKRKNKTRKSKATSAEEEKEKERKRVERSVCLSHLCMPALVFFPALLPSHSLLLLSVLLFLALPRPSSLRLCALSSLSPFFFFSFLFHVAFP